MQHAISISTMPHQFLACHPNVSHATSSWHKQILRFTLPPAICHQQSQLFATSNPCYLPPAPNQLSLWHGRRNKTSPQRRGLDNSCTDSAVTSYHQYDGFPGRLWLFSYYLAIFSHNYDYDEVRTWDRYSVNRATCTEFIFVRKFQFQSLRYNFNSSHKISLIWYK